MLIPANIKFSQASLQDYVDYPRRCYLKYLLRLAWPAVESEPALENERLMRQGAWFHRLVQQSMLGISTERLERMLHEPGLAVWWKNFQDSQGWLQLDQGQVYPEASLAANLAGYSLFARYDLVWVAADGRVRIIDWKTSRLRPKRAWMAERLQTRGYPYLLLRAGAHFSAGQAIQPEQVELVYWFSQFPQQPEIFAYSQEQFEADQAFLTGLIEEIESLPAEGFQLTQDLQKSKLCVYRSLCERGVEAGRLDEAAEISEMGEGAGPDFQFEQIQEVEF